MWIRIYNEDAIHYAASRWQYVIEAEYGSLIDPNSARHMLSHMKQFYLDVDRDEVVVEELINDYDER